MQTLSYILLNCIVALTYAIPTEPAPQADLEPTAQVKQKKILSGRRAREGTGRWYGSVMRHSPFDFVPEEVFQHVKTEASARILGMSISPDPVTAEKQWTEIRTQLRENPQMRLEILNGINLDYKSRKDLERSLASDRWTEVLVEKDTYIKGEARLAPSPPVKLEPPAQKKIIFAQEGSGHKYGAVTKQSPFGFFPEEVFQHVKTEGFARILYETISPNPETAAKQWTEIRTQLRVNPQMRLEILNGINLDYKSRKGLEISLEKNAEKAVLIETQTYIKKEAQIAANKAKLEAAAQAKPEPKSYQERFREWSSKHVARLEATPAGQKIKSYYKASKDRLQDWSSKHISRLKSTPAGQKIHSYYRAVRPAQVRPLL